ncbi:hypothetical protein D3C86_1897010 [compost metagenome]
MGLKAQGLGLVVVNGLSISLAFIGDMRQLTINYMLSKTSLLSPCDKLSTIATKTHHLVMSRGYVMLSISLHIVQQMSSVDSMSVNMLPHLSTIHDMQELSTTTDASHLLASE